MEWLEVTARPATGSAHPRPGSCSSSAACRRRRTPGVRTAAAPPRSSARTSSVARRAPSRFASSSTCCSRLRPDALPAKRRTHRDVVDVDLIDDQPERAEAGDALLGCADDEDVADGAVLQLPGVHLPRPRIGERLLFDREDAVEILVAVERVDPVIDGATGVLGHLVRARRRCRLTYSGRIACGACSPVDDTRAARIAMVPASGGAAGSAIRAASPSMRRITSACARAPSPMNSVGSTAQRFEQHLGQAHDRRSRLRVHLRTAPRTPPRARHRPRWPPVRAVPRNAHASASKPDTPISGFPSANASPCIVAMPMRSPVNEPGRSRPRRRRCRRAGYSRARAAT